MKKNSCATVRGNHRNSAFESRYQSPGIIQRIGKCLQRVFHPGVAEQRDLMVCQRIVEWQAARIIRLDVLCAGQPFDQAGATANEPFQFSHGVATIGVKACAKQDFFVRRGQVGNEIVVGHHQRVALIACSIFVVSRIKGQKHGTIHHAAIHPIQNPTGNLLVTIRPGDHLRWQLQVMHQSSEGISALKCRRKTIAAFARTNSGNVNM